MSYRAITPVERWPRIETQVVSETGRKRVLAGTLYNGDAITAETEGLFVELRPGQS